MKSKNTSHKAARTRISVALRRKTDLKPNSVSDMNVLFQNSRKCISLQPNYNLRIQMPLFALGECLKQPEAMRDSCTCRLAKLLNLSFAEFHDYFINSC